MEMPSSHPFDQLAALEQQAMQRLQPGVEAAEKQHPWRGIRLTVNGHDLVIALGEITEILAVPKTTVLPNVQPWVKGLANIRGRIVPIMDLGDFLERDSPLADTARRRTLVIEQQAGAVGLIVDQVQGIMTFSETRDDRLPGGLGPAYQPFITGCFLRERAHLVFSTRRLLSHQRFLRAARH